MNLVLIGFMGSGKTTVGKRLAELLKYDFIDTDDLVEREARATVPEIFEREGEETFRAYERQAVREAVSGDDRVVACGGGVVLDDGNIEILRAKGRIFYLAAEVGEILSRTKGNQERPLINVDQRELEVASLLQERKPLYEKAAHEKVKVDSRDVEDITKDILKKWKKYR